MQSLCKCGSWNNSALYKYKSIVQIVQILEFCANTRVPVRAVAWSALISDQLALQMFKRSFNNCPVLCDMLWCTATYYTNWTLFKIEKNWLQCDTLHCMIWYSANTSVFNEEKSGLATADNVYAPSYTRLNSCRCKIHICIWIHAPSCRCNTISHNCNSSVPCTRSVIDWKCTKLPWILHFVQIIVLQQEITRRSIFFANNQCENFTGIYKSFKISSLLLFWRL